MSLFKPWGSISAVAWAMISTRNITAQPRSSLPDTRLPGTNWLDSDCSTHSSLPAILEIALAKTCKSESEIKNVLRKLWSVSSFPGSVNPGTDVTLVKKWKARQFLPRAKARTIISDQDVAAYGSNLVASLRRLGHTVHLKTPGIILKRWGYQAVPTEAS